MSMKPVAPESDFAAVWRIAEETGTLPMPGGHGVWPILPPGSCRHYTAMFPLALRARTIVLMLAHARLGWEDHKATAKEWVDRVSMELNHVLAGGGGSISNPLDRAWRGLAEADDAAQSVRAFSPLELLDALYDVVEPHVHGDQTDRATLDQLRADSKQYMRAIGYRTPDSALQVPRIGKALAALCTASKAILPIGESAVGLPQSVQGDDRARVAYRVLAYFHSVHASRFERWLAKAWRDATLAWFAVYAPDWDGREPRQKCDAMLDAIVTASKPSVEEAEAARSRVKALDITAKPLPSPLRQPDGHAIWQPTLEQTRQLCDDLRDPSEGLRLRARLLIRSLLTRLGMTAHLTKHPTTPTKLGFYEPVMNLLSTCCSPDAVVDDQHLPRRAESCPGLRDAITQAADLTEGLRQVVADITEWKDDKTSQPRFFALHDNVAPPSIHALSREVEKALQPSIRALDIAATLVVDVLLDAMQAGQARYFGQRQYAFLSGAIKGKESLHNYFTHLAQDPCAMRIAVQACVPVPVESARERCPLCLRRLGIRQ